MAVYRDIQHVLENADGHLPIRMFSASSLRETAQQFLMSFPGDVLYAVKCNPMPEVMSVLFAAGIRAFDVASIAEAKLVRDRAPGARSHFMHPVKSMTDIRVAIEDFGIDTFAVDTDEELEKVISSAGGRRLEIIVRLAVPKTGAIFDLSGKFGAGTADAADLLRKTIAAGHRPGLTFHVGSQAPGSAPFVSMIEMAAAVSAFAGVPLDVLDIGGGFPAAYRGIEPCFDEIAVDIAAAVDRAGLAATRLACEPGRALVASSMAIACRVERRRNGMLFLNDGIYGNLSELKYIGSDVPVALWREGELVKGGVEPFGLYGPTCDSADIVPGPFLLPDSVRTGDMLVFQMMGAYSSACSTAFNGYGRTDLVAVESLAQVSPSPRLELSA